MSKRPGVAPSLTRELIARSALQMADECGIDNVSIRKLAARLGKAPMALYTYFDSMQQIREEVLALAFREVDANPVPGERWDDTMRRTTASIRDMYRRHVKAELTRIEGFGYSPGMQEHTARIYRLHEEQGIPSDVLRRAWCVIDAFLGGFLAAEAEELNGRTQHPDAAGRVWVETAERAYGDEAFSDGIEIIVAGIRALAAPDPCDWHTPA